MKTKAIKSNTILLSKIKQAFIVIGIIMVFSACQQNGKSQTKDNLVLESSKNTQMPKPNISIKVDKHFDEKGNMTGYDSVYSSLYISGDTTGLTKSNPSFLMYGFENPFEDFRVDSMFLKPLSPVWSKDKPPIFQDESFFHRMSQFDSIMNQLLKREKMQQLNKSQKQKTEDGRKNYAKTQVSES